MGRPGITWFNGGPGEMAQRLSVAEEAIPGKANKLVTELVEAAEDRMREIIDSGGENKTKKGGPRRLSDAMYSSVASTINKNARGRVQAEFGFIDNAPLWTKFQERGTLGSGPMRARGASGGGIPPMHAYAIALGETITAFQDKIDSVQWFAMSQMSSVRR